MKCSIFNQGLLARVATGLCLAAAPFLVPAADPPIDPEIQALLVRHDQALKNQDLAAIIGTFAPGANTVLLGTGPGERWLGQQEIKQAYEHFFADYDRGTMTRECGSRASGRKGTLAWLAATCHFTDSLKGQKRAYDVNITAVAEKQDGAWRFRSFHFSNLTGADTESPAGAGDR